MPRPEPISVWLHGMPVAELTTNGKPGHVACRYTEAALGRWGDGIPVLSCSLPTRSRPYREARNFFRGLLPEGAAHSAMASIAGVPAYDTFSLLRRFGRDVAGALVIGADPPEASDGAAELYTDTELAAEVAGLDERPLALHDDSELSLPGVQKKMTLISTDRGWARPVGGRPSTHILKVEDRRFPGMAAAEAACLRLARRLGLTTVHAEVVDVGGIPCMIVSRYDRTVGDDGAVARIHQEDACQATNTDATIDRGRGKYERGGGPSLAHVAALLDRHGRTDVGELEALLGLVTFTVLIGNADAHGKNISFLHDPDGHITLAPAYDTVPTVLWSKLPRRPGMSIGGCDDIGAVTADHLVAEARRWPLSERRAHQVIERVAVCTRDEIEAVAAVDELASGVADRADSLLDGLVPP
ncbi:MAG: HipA domain-containing protein [Acidimicrobiia bacterium]|nr:HipA domain-containing protein [Acidimicrobiia bacterium]